MLDGIENAIASGTTHVSYDGKSVEFASLDDLLRVRGIIQVAIGLLPAASTTVLASHSRGFVGGGSA